MVMKRYSFLSSLFYSTLPSTLQANKPPNHITDCIFQDYCYYTTHTGGAPKKKLRSKTRQL